MKAGIYDLTAGDYHGDQLGDRPALSSHIAALLLNRSARHAWFNHPKLNPAYAPTYSDAFDLGNACHAYLLEGRSGFEIIEATDFRTKAAREARDAARAAGKVPLLAERWADVQMMAETVRAQLAQHEDPPVPFTGGKPEQTLVWTEGDVLCKARLDWLHDDHLTADDLKTAENANPDLFSRTLWSMGYDVQAAFYLRGLKATTGQDATFRFVVVETRAPYACSVVALDPAALDLANRRVAHAIEAWRYCLETNLWPGYPTRTCWVSPPPWIEAQHAEREYRAQDRPVIDDGRDVSEQLMEGRR